MVGSPLSIGKRGIQLLFYLPTDYYRTLFFYMKIIPIKEKCLHNNRKMTIFGVTKSNKYEKNSILSSFNRH